MKKNTSIREEFRSHASQANITRMIHGLHQNENEMFSSISNCFLLILNESKGVRISLTL